MSVFAGTSGYRLLLGVAAIVLSLQGAVAAPFDDCKDHLPFGAPTLNRKAPTTPICHIGYAVLHDDQLLIPRWVAYRLTGPNTLGCVKRGNNFHADENLPEDKRAIPSDYAKSGFDQGHQAPAQDFAWNKDRMSDSFSMANMAPQAPGLNRAQWLRLEETVRAWATERGALIVYVGPLVLHTDGKIGKRDIKVGVPMGFWKVIVDPEKKEALAFAMPQKAIPKGALEPWQTNIGLVEETTGIKLPLPEGVDREAKPSLWPADLKGWAKQHKAVCSPAKKKRAA